MTTLHQTLWEYSRDWLALRLCGMLVVVHVRFLIVLLRLFRLAQVMPMNHCSMAVLMCVPGRSVFPFPAETFAVMVSNMVNDRDCGSEPHADVDPLSRPHRPYAVDSSETPL